MIIRTPQRARVRAVWAGAVAVAMALLAACASPAAAVDIIAADLQFPEGTIFVGPTLYFVDYGTSDVLRLVGGKLERVWRQEGCGANGLVQLGATLLVACFENGTVVQITLDGRTVDTIRQDQAGKPFVAPNDLAADRKGGVYFTASGSELEWGRVYYRAANGRVTAVAADIHYANGVALSPDGATLYVAETRARRLLRFAIGPDGGLSDRQVFASLNDILRKGPGATYSPDGVRVDSRGRIFIGLYDGGGFAVLGPDGAVLKQIDLPEPHHATLALSPDGQSVYVTAVHDGADGLYHGALYRVPNPMAQ